MTCLQKMLLNRHAYCLYDGITAGRIQTGDAQWAELIDMGETKPEYA